MRSRVAVAAICAALDLILFEVLIARSVAFGDAHLLSFAAALLLGLGLLNEPWRIRGWVLAAGAAAALLRGGVLAILVRTFHLSAGIAFLPVVAIAPCLIGSALWLSSRPGGVRRWRAIALGAAGYLALLRLVYMGQAELLPEEAYYWNYAQHMDIGYLDHPPMVAWLIGGGLSIFGNTEFAVRIAAWLCWLATGFFTFRLTRNLLDETTAWCALLLVAALPFFFGVSFVMTPDSPLTACWAASLFFFERALIAEHRRAWLGLGLAMGLGLLSKYSIGLLGLAGVVFLLVDKPSRRWFWRWEPYAAALLACALFTPVLVWNAEHHWISFNYQSARRMSADARFSTHELLGSVIAAVGPVGFAALVLLCFAKGEEPHAQRRARLFMKVFTAAPFAVFLFFSLRHMVKLSWTGPVWLAAIPMLAYGLCQPATRPSDRWLRTAWLPTLAVCILGYGLFLHYLVLGLPGVGYSKQMNLLPVGWRELARQIDVIEERLETEVKMEPLIVGTDRNFISSEMAFYDDEQPAGAQETAGIRMFGKNSLMYDFWYPNEQQTGKAMVLVAFEESDLRRKAIEEHTARLGPVESGQLSRDGKLIRRYFYRLAYGYSADREEEKDSSE